MFNSLREEDMQLFFRDWMKYKKQTEYLAYDVTSISSYSENIRKLEKCSARSCPGLSGLIC